MVACDIFAHITGTTLVVMHSTMIKTTVIRQARMTAAQKHALAVLHEHYQLDLTSFNDDPRPLVLEVGCGSGAVLVDAAQAYPEFQFIGIDVYQPGLGNLLQQLALHTITNVRVFCGDVRELIHYLPKNRIHTVQIFFPDPWPKSRHHKRRLIQAGFIKRLLPLLLSESQLHIITDWPHYAEHIERILSEFPEFIKVAEASQSGLPVFKKVATTYENKAIKVGRHAIDLRYLHQAVSLG